MSRKRSKRHPCLWDCMRHYPPFYVRILAKKKRAVFEDLAMSDEEVTIRSGLTINRMREISRMRNWADVTLGEFKAFAVGCDFDLTNPADRRRIIQYKYVCKKRRKRPFLYVTKSKLFESTFLPLIRMMASYDEPSGDSSPSPPAEGPKKMLVA